MVDGWVLAAENPRIKHGSSQHATKEQGHTDASTYRRFRAEATSNRTVFDQRPSKCAKLVTYRVREEVGIKPEALSSLALQSLSKLDVAPATLSQNNGRR
jgi:hypothetical protein